MLMISKRSERSKSSNSSKELSPTKSNLNRKDSELLKTTNRNISDIKHLKTIESIGIPDIKHSKNSLIEEIPSPKEIEKLNT